MFFTQFIARKRRQMRHRKSVQKRSALYWGTPSQQTFAFGSAMADGFVGAIMAMAIVMGMMLGV